MPQWVMNSLERESRLKYIPPPPVEAEGIAGTEAATAARDETTAEAIATASRDEEEAIAAATPAGDETATGTTIAAAMAAAVKDKSTAATTRQEQQQQK